MQIILYLIIGLVIIAMLAIIGFILINKLIFTPDKLDKSHYPLNVEDIHGGQELTLGEGNNPLRGWLFNQASTKGLIIIAHEIGCTVDWYVPEITRFINDGYKVFALEYSGYRNGQGKFKGITQAALELKQALELMDEKLPITLFGHGMGAYASCILPTITETKIDRIIACAPFYSVEDHLNDFSKSFSKKWLFVKAIYAYQKIIFGKKAKLTAADGLNAKPIKTLVLQGKNDEELSANSSLLTKTDFITNPNVTFKLIDDEGSNGHFTILRKDFSRDINPVLFDYINEFLKSE